MCLRNWFKSILDASSESFGISEDHGQITLLNSTNEVHEPLQFTEALRMYVLWKETKPDPMYTCPLCRRVVTGPPGASEALFQLCSLLGTSKPGLGGSNVPEDYWSDFFVLHRPLTFRAGQFVLDFKPIHAQEL